MRRLLLLLLPPLLQLQASTGFLLPIGRPRPVTRTLLFSSSIAPTASPPVQSQQQQHEAQKEARLRFEGFCPEEGAAAGDTITVVYDPRAPGIDAPIALGQQADGGGGSSDDGSDDEHYGILQDREEVGGAAGPASTAAAASAPCLLFGFDGWDGSERPFVTPLFPGEEEGTWAASVHLPNYARELDCAVSDGGLEFDTNGGRYYRFLVTHVQVLAADGVTVRTFRQGSDGSLTPTGVLALNDPQELERMVEEELERRRGGGGDGGGGEEGVAAAVDDGILPAGLMVEEDEIVEESIEEARLLDTMMTMVEEVEGGAEARRLAASGATGVTLSPQAAERAGSLQQRRAEANVLGERVGLPAVVVNDVREAFDDALEPVVAGTYEGPAAALLGEEQVGRALGRLGLEGFGPGEVGELCDRVLGAGGQGGKVSLEGLMRLFQVLDEEDCGISIV